MTLVQNHLLRLSGNRYLLFLILISLFCSACSPQVIQRTTVKPNMVVREKKNDSENSQKVTKQTVQTTEKKTKKNTTNDVFKMAVLLPFKSHSMQIATASKVQLQSMDVSIDFYQGLMLGLKEQLNNKVKVDIQVLDTKEDAVVLRKFQNDGLLQKDLLIGPLYPTSIKQINPYLKSQRVLSISPLSAASPAVFQNADLISMMPNIAIHADKLLQKLKQDFSKFNNTNYILINPKDEESEMFAKEIRAYFQKYFPGKHLIEIQSPQQITSFKINENPFAVLVSSASRAKTAPLLNALGKLKDNNTAAVLKVYGHPNWAKQGYSLAILNKLNIHFTAVSYHAHLISKSNDFENKYKSEYFLNPGEYAYIGYDLGTFISKCLNESGGASDFTNSLENIKFKGLGSDFDLVFHPQFGYVNLGLRMLEYIDNQLIVR